MLSINPIVLTDPPVPPSTATAEPTNSATPTAQPTFTETATPTAQPSETVAPSEALDAATFQAGITQLSDSLFVVGVAVCLAVFFLAIIAVMKLRR